jgi:hypothetical protein
MASHPPVRIKLTLKRKPDEQLPSTEDPSPTSKKKKKKSFGGGGGGGMSAQKVPYVPAMKRPVKKKPLLAFMESAIGQFIK